jgi:hypothetical protein
MLKDFIKRIFDKAVQPTVVPAISTTPKQVEHVEPVGAFKYIADLPKSEREYILASEMNDSKFEHYAFFNCGYVESANGKGFLMVPIPHKQKVNC